MLEKVERTLERLMSWVRKDGLGDQSVKRPDFERKPERNRSPEGNDKPGKGRNTMKVLRKGPAMRVIFFYPGEEGTYVDHSDVTLYENGIVHIVSNQEETTTHLQNCEILWRFETDAEERTNKVRLLKPKQPEPRSHEEP
jgi:hypothetical protein